ncbi:MAG: glycosyltransferase [Rhodobacteraceae bacterium HLUCCA12]|nr:MAG: glycosyltransferase [Rhodobacteraceae bacterium HLUCCA12]
MQAQTMSAGEGAVQVGIVIRTRDRPLFVRRALASVLAQSWPHWRIALINDGGARDTLEAAIADVASVRAFPDGALVVEHLAQSIGRSAAFNLGMERLDTEFVTCLDDDDTWSPDFLRDLVAFHARTAPLVPDLGGVMCGLTAIREDVIELNGKPTIVTLGEDGLPNSFKRDDFFLNPIAYACYRQDVYPVQWMLRREAARAVGGFPEDFNVMEDRAFMTRFLQHWRVAMLDRPLAFHHRRVSRRDDRARRVEMNTIDNPSYDWRLFSDLARVPVHSPPGTDADRTAHDTRLRAIATTVLREVNDETSALWHKLDGEAGRLHQRLDRLEGRLAHAAPETAALDADPETCLWSLWDRMGEQDIAHPVAPGHPFAERLELSQPFDLPGRLLHVSKAARRLIVQLPQTRDWSALEIALDGLAGPGHGLRCQFEIEADTGYLFETALSIIEREGLGRRQHKFLDTHVHSCQAHAPLRVTRDLTPAMLSRGESPKLSIILPRQALNFRFCCRDLVISRL